MDSIEELMINMGSKINQLLFAENKISMPIVMEYDFSRLKLPIRTVTQFEELNNYLENRDISILMVSCIFIHF